MCTGSGEVPRRGMVELRSIKISVFVWILLNHQQLFCEGDEKVVVIPKGQSQSFMLTNSSSAFFYAETGSANRTELQGLNVRTVEFLEDYIIEANGKTLNREEAVVYVYPNKIVRRYEGLELMEEVALLDSMPVLTIKLTSPRKLPLTLIPLISGSNRSKEYATYWADDDHLLYISRKNDTDVPKIQEIPVWTGVYTYPKAEFLDSDTDFQRYYVSYGRKEGFLPGKLNLFLDGTAYIFIIVGDDKNDLMNKQKFVLKKLNIEFIDPEEKIEGVRKT